MSDGRLVLAWAIFAIALAGFLCAGFLEPFGALGGTDLPDPVTGHVWKMHAKGRGTYYVTLIYFVASWAKWLFLALVFASLIWKDRIRKEDG